MTSPTSIKQRTSVDDPEYAPFLFGIASVFLARARNAKALFTVDTEGLWDAYLAAFPEAQRQTYNCSACRHFVERFGGIVTVREDGARVSACWEIEMNAPMFRPVALALSSLVERRPVVGAFLSKADVLGTPHTGAWTHISATLPQRFVFVDRLLTPGQRAAAIRENVATVERALEEFSPEALSEALRIFEADALSRSEKFIGPVRWLSELHAARATAKDERKRSALLWQAVATAPEGYSHPRASVVGPLLEGILAGKSFDVLRAEFADMLHPLRYQRPQAAPSAGNIAEAERIVAQLGLTPALERRFARLDECETVWTPAPAKEKPIGGVFSHLTPKDAENAALGVTLPAQTMTWEKFTRTVMPTAEAINLYVPRHGPFIALVTATNADAPRIVRWDREDRRNAVTWFVYHNGSPATQWGLPPLTWHRVTGVVPLPNLWGDRPAEQHGIGAVIVLDGAVDTYESGNSIFPEMLTDELRAVRSTIEAYSKAAKFSGRESASACGFDVRKGIAQDVRLRVMSAGRWTDYRIDRWD